MSRVGKRPVEVPESVTVDIASSKVTTKGPKGELSINLPKGIKVEADGAVLNVKRLNDEKEQKAKHGLVRSLVQNMVTGVSEGFKKQLQVTGVGFKVNVQGQKLVLALGFSHDIEYQIPEGLSITADKNTITVEGIDKQQVGNAAAEIRAFHKPEPYKGKGIAYVDEYIIRKAGKAAATAGE